jgi:uracil-DNA glycosylase
MPTGPEHDAAPFVPTSRSLRALRIAAAGCRGCPLHVAATQTVFGEGPRTARLTLVGEVPRRSGGSRRTRVRRARRSRATATSHPSAILRARGHEARDAMRAALVADLHEVAVFLDR